MISARVPGLPGLARQLATRAARLASATAQSRNDPHRWRKARLLWPLFTKD